MVVVEDGLHGDAPADDTFVSDEELLAFFHQAELEVVAGGGGQGQGAAEDELEWLFNDDAFPAVETMGNKGERRCQHCGTTKTPQWRLGPEGPGTLCNACGVRYRTGRLVPEYRPLNSPTFSPAAHSNMHRRVVEMRRRRGSSATDVMNAGLEVATGGGCEGLEVAAGGGGEGLELAAGGGGEGPAAAEELDSLSNKDAVETSERKPSVEAPQTTGVSRRRRAQPSSHSPPQPPTTVPRQCRHCGTTETPQWREGPEGRLMLCNACGVTYGKGRLVPENRPLRSPTFSPELHSNMHRRVIQMHAAGQAKEN